MFITILFMVAKIWKQTKVHITDEWIKKRWYTYTREKYLFKYISLKKGYYEIT